MWISLLLSLCLAYCYFFLIFIFIDFGLDWSSFLKQFNGGSMLEKTGKPLRVMVFTVRNSDAQSMPSHACCHVETFENIYMLRFFFLERGFEVC